MKKIMLVGSGGSGKSTLAMKLGDILSIEVFHLDSLYWHPGWVPTPKEEWKSIQENLIQRQKWIIDGNYSKTMDIRLGAADTVIFLDLPRLVCLWHIFKRRFRYATKKRPDMAEGCPEHLDLEFIRWVWNFPKDRKPEIINKLQTCGNKEVIILHSPREINKWLNKIKEEI
jgi:adenylate kinase family enzyme